MEVLVLVDDLTNARVSPINAVYESPYHKVLTRLEHAIALFRRRE